MMLTTGREKVRQETWQVIDSIIEPYQWVCRSSTSTSCRRVRRKR
jgi:hypothetical protein